MAMRIRLIGLVGWAVSGCGGDEGPGANEGESEAEAEGQEAEAEAESEAEAEGCGPDCDACRNVDIVMAVDNSSSMEEEKAALRDEVFPLFASEIVDVGMGLDDFRVGVIDACPDPPDFHTQGSGGDCAFASEERWMQGPSDGIVDEFSCVGDICACPSACSGENDDEQPASAAAAALEASAEGGANEGFLRDYALLVVIAITDEDEQPTPNATAAEVVDRLVAIKGDIRKIVFYGIGGEGCPDGGTYGTAEDAQKLREITQAFIDADRGVWWNLCEGSLDDGLATALDIISFACSELPGID